jgi:hypothetical protein
MSLLQKTVPLEVGIQAVEGWTFVSSSVTLDNFATEAIAAV